MNWKDIEPSDLSQLKEIRIQYHQIVQVVSAVGRHYLDASEVDDNATLYWNRANGSLVGQWVQTESGPVRAGFQLSEAKLYLENSSTFEKLPVAGKTLGQLMVWMEEQAGRLALPTSGFSTDAPYELPTYPKLSSRGFDVEPGPMTHSLSSYYASSFEILDSLQWDFTVEADVLVYPHHFDQALSFKLKDSGSYDTSTFLTLGMSPGDEEFDAPYFYVNSWPHVDESVLKPLTAGRWYTSDWIGGLVTIEELWGVDNQREYLETFYKETSSQLQTFLLD
ncbi:MAG: hypothetical protein AAGA85_02575 [Bacteroidota bacterium]